MDVTLNLYICAAYALVFTACVAGAFSENYCANLLQRIALSTLAFWVVWRAGLILERGWGGMHEPVVATALALYSIGSLIKTLKFTKESQQ